MRENNKTMQVVVDNYRSESDKAELFKLVQQKVRKLENSYSFYGHYSDQQILNTINRGFEKHQDVFLLYFFPHFGNCTAAKIQNPPFRATKLSFFENSVAPTRRDFSS